jgi:uncharacterized membrane protein
MAAFADSVDAMLKPPRVGILDTARGAALLAMASYHLSWDLEFFGYIEAGTAETGLLKIYARAIASTFLFLAGISLVLANTPDIRWPSYKRRLGMIVAAAATVSLVTFVGMRHEWIFFGILHCIAAASVIGLVFLRAPVALTLVVATALLTAVVVDNLIAPYFLHSTFFDAPWLWWVGLSENPPRSNDYVPIFPWLTPFLFGLGFARFAYMRGWFGALADLGTGGSLVARAGRHSLIFYIVHQPVLIGIVYLLSLIVAAPKPDPTAGYLRQCNAVCTQSGSEALCTSFCQCTLDQLTAQSLLDPLQSGEIQVNTDERIQRIAIQCSAKAQ